MQDTDTFHLKGSEWDDQLRVVSYTRRSSTAPMFRRYEEQTVGHRM